MVIDLHSHYIPPAYLESVREEGNPYGRHVTKLPSGEPALFGDNRLIPLLAGFHDVDVKIRDMEKQGVERQVVSPPPFLFQYDLPDSLGIEMARLLNDEAYALEKSRPDRFVAMATVPLQNPEAAAAELERAVTKLGMRSVEIGASANSTIRHFLRSGRQRRGSARSCSSIPSVPPDASGWVITISSI